MWYSICTINGAINLSGRRRPPNIDIGAITVNSPWHPAWTRIIPMSIESLIANIRLLYPDAPAVTPDSAVTPAATSLPPITEPPVMRKEPDSNDPALTPTSLPPIIKPFVMRKEPWEFAEKMLLGPITSKESDGPRMLVVTGVGGCGKTQLMLNFLHSNAKKFVSAFFVDGTSEFLIRADITRHVQDMDAKYAQAKFEECLSILSQPSPDGPRVILYDNVDDPALNIRPLLPKGDACSIIITSRNPSVGELRPDSHLKLDKMSADESVELLLHDAERSGSVDDVAKKDAQEIAETLGHLPLALEHARSYMHDKKCSPRAYLDKLAGSHDQPRVEETTTGRDMAHVAFEESFGQLDGPSQGFLRLLSLYYRSNFPLDLVVQAAKYNFSEYELKLVPHEGYYHIGKAVLEELFLQNGQWDIENLNRLVEALQNSSFISVVPGRGTQLVDVHPLIRTWVQSRLSKEERFRYQSAAVVLLALGDREGFTPSSQYIHIHVSHLAPLWGDLKVNELSAFSSILCKGALYDQAVLLQEVAFAELLEMGNDPGDKRLMVMLSLMVDRYQAAGKTEKALDMQKDQLGLYETRLGKKHTLTLTATAKVADTCSSLGLHKEALVIRHQVLKLYKEVHGEKDIVTISMTGNLANSLSALGHHAQAVKLREETLELFREVHGEKHPDTISAMNNLGNSYEKIGDMDRALELQLKTLELRKELLGEEHLDTIVSYNNLAIAYSRLGRAEEAMKLQEDVLRLRKAILGEQHPDTLSAMSNLAVSYSDLGRLDEALELDKEAYRLQKQILGRKHPDTLLACNNLSLSYKEHGDLAEALLLQEELPSLFMEVYGPQRLETYDATLNLAETYEALGKEATALELVKKVEGAITTKFGHDDYINRRYRSIKARLEEEASLE